MLQLDTSALASSNTASKALRAGALRPRLENQNRTHSWQARLLKMKTGQSLIFKSLVFNLWAMQLQAETDGLPVQLLMLVHLNSKDLEVD
ncbi:MAG TPA: hypothetical protein VGN44_15055 [Candidatus Angelobacter sp.]